MYPEFSRRRIHASDYVIASFPTCLYLIEWLCVGVVFGKEITI